MIGECSDPILLFINSYESIKFFNFNNLYFFIFLFQGNITKHLQKYFKKNIYIIIFIL